MATIKQTIEAEALKAGKAVRDALHEFAQATGMQAEINVEWISGHHMQDAASSNYIGRVSLLVGGLTVEA